MGDGVFYRCTIMNHPYPTITGWWLGHPSEKYESQLGWLATQYMEKQNDVPNHQPDHVILIHDYPTILSIIYPDLDRSCWRNGSHSISISHGTHDVPMIFPSKTFMLPSLVRIIGVYATLMSQPTSETRGKNMKKRTWRRVFPTLQRRLRRFRVEKRSGPFGPERLAKRKKGAPVSPGDGNRPPEGVVQVAKSRDEFVRPLKWSCVS